jgi:hypothetical protein
MKTNILSRDLIDNMPDKFIPINLENYNYIKEEMNKKGIEYKTELIRDNIESVVFETKRENKDNSIEIMKKEKYGTGTRYYVNEVFLTVALGYQK